MNELPHEMLERLDRLAEAAGASGEVMWAALVEGGFVVGVTGAIILFLSTLLFLGSAYLFYKGIKDGDGDLGVPGLVFGTISLIIMFIGGLPRAKYLLAPSLYAAERVLEILR